MSVFLSAHYCSCVCILKILIKTIISRYVDAMLWMGLILIALLKSMM